MTNINFNFNDLIRVKNKRRAYDSNIDDLQLHLLVHPKLQQYEHDDMIDDKQTTLNKYLRTK